MSGLEYNTLGARDGEHSEILEAVIAVLPRCSTLAKYHVHANMMTSRTSL